MVFSSSLFLLYFFPVFLIVYYLIAQGGQEPLCLAGKYILLCLGST